MRKLLLVLTLSLSMSVLTGCGLGDIKQKVENKIKDTVVTSLASEMGIDPELAKSLTENISMGQIKQLAEAFTSGNYEEVANIVSTIDFSQIEGLESIDPTVLENLQECVTEENITEAMNFLEDAATSVEDIDVDKVISKLEEKGFNLEELDVESLSEAEPMINSMFDTFVQQYRDTGVEISDEQVSELKEKFIQELNKHSSSN